MNERHWTVIQVTFVACAVVITWTIAAITVGYVLGRSDRVECAK